MTSPSPAAVDKAHQELREGREIGAVDRPRLGLNAGNIEGLLDALVKQHNVLLRGSGSAAPSGTPIGLSPTSGWGYATDHAGIALLQALFSNQAPRHLDKWAYPLFISRDHPLIVRVVNPRPGFRRDRGYVYVLDREGFSNHPVPSWQWITTRRDRVVLGRLEVQRLDFHYPVESVPRL
jgi:hypothetical protein